MIVNTILHGNNIETLKTIPEKSVNCCVTSPPYYGLRDYGTATWEGGDPKCDHKIPVVEYDKLRSNAELDASHIMRFNRKNCYKCGAIRIDQQIGLEETPEDYIKKLVDVFREVKRVLCDDGTLWVNIGDSYNGYGLECKNLKQKDLIGVPWLLAFALRDDGWYLRQDIIWHKPNPMPESVTDRCTKSHEYIFLFSKNAKYYYDHETIKEPCSQKNIDDFLSRKTMDNKGGGDGTFENVRPDLCKSREVYMSENFRRNKRDVWIVNTKPNTYAHFATYPEELIIPCILAGSREGGIVLDPFMGSGTTAVTALKLLRKYIGCEINPEYVKIAERRIANERGLFND